MLMQVNAGPTVGQLVVALIGAIPILGIMGWTAVKILGPIGQALGKRIAGDGGGNHLLDQRLEELGADVLELRQQLAETHERLDFTERLLSQDRASAQLRRGEGA